MRHSAKLTASASNTVDDVKGTLEKYITSDYYRSETEFLAHVEEDAENFKPPGENIYSYTRPSPASRSKGKGVATALSEEDEDAVVYEVYHVCSHASVAVYVLTFTGQMGHARVQRTSQADADLHLTLCRRRLVY